MTKQTQLIRIFFIIGVIWCPFSTALDENQILPIGQGYTLAQVLTANKVQTILVTRDTGKHIRGINLSSIAQFYPDESLDMIEHLGNDRINAIHEQESTNLHKYERQELIMPPVLKSSQIAAGTNYVEHGEEAGIQQVFLFPKYSHPSSFESTVGTSSNELLDYEIELCARFQSDIKNLEEFQQTIKGFFLCGDFTDRATLLRNIDVDNPASGKGFTDAKSGDDRFPIGPYTVVPYDWEKFVDSLALTLKVNGEERQHSQASDMIKKLDEIISDTLAEGDDTRWTYQGRSTTLIKGGRIEKGETILTGTPSGVVFNQPTLLYKVEKGSKWFFTLSFLESGPVEYVLEEYIRDSLDEKIYLQPGDEVALQATWLGTINLKISSSP